MAISGTTQASAAPVASSRRRPRGRTRPRWSRYRPRTFWLFVSPWVLGFLLLTVAPMAFAFWMSVTDYDGISPTTNYVGATNYSRALHDPQMWSSLRQTLLLMLVVVPLTVGAGLFLAVVVNRDIRGKAGYRAILYLPAVVPVVAGALTFRLLFDHDAGAINGLLSALGLDAVQWLAGGASLIVLISFVLWGVGGHMVISLAALQGVPRELTEAAMVDGAGPFTRFRKITVPIISPVLLFQMVTSVIFAFQLFVPAVLLSSGDIAGGVLPQIPRGSRVYMIYVYQQYFALGDFGYASALLWLLFLVVVLITIVVFGGSRRMVYYAAGDEGGRK